MSWSVWRSAILFAGSKLLGTGERLSVRLPGGPVTVRLRARDSRGRTATAVAQLRIDPEALRVQTLRVPDGVRVRARRVSVRIATTVPATLRAGGQSFRVGPDERTVGIPLPERPEAGLLKVPLTLTALGPRQPALRETIVVVRG